MKKEFVWVYRIKAYDYVTVPVKYIFTKYITAFSLFSSLSPNSIYKKKKKISEYLTWISLQFFFKWGNAMNMIYHNISMKLWFICNYFGISSFFSIWIEYFALYYFFRYVLHFRMLNTYNEKTTICYNMHSWKHTIHNSLRVFVNYERKFATKFHVNVYVILDGPSSTFSDLYVRAFYSFVTITFWTIGEQ